MIYATKEENDHVILFDHSQQIKRQMQPQKPSGKAEKGNTETIAPFPSTNSPEAMHINSHHRHSRKVKD